MSFVTAEEFSVMVTKITSRIGVSWTHSFPFWLWPLFNSMKWPYYQKDVNQINFKSHNHSLKLSFTNIRGLRSNFVERESIFPRINSLDITDILLDLSLENSADSFLCFQLALLQSVSYFFLFHWSPSFPLCTVFGAFSANIDKALSINLSANVFLETLTSILRTGQLFLWNC